MGILFLFFGLTAFAQEDGWKSHTQCESNEKPVANRNGAFTSSWTTSSSSSTQKEGAQNHYNGTINAGVKDPVGAVQAGGNAGVNRDGEKTTNNRGNSSSTTHTINYDCKPIEEEK